MQQIIYYMLVYIYIYKDKGKGKVIPLQVQCGPEGSITVALNGGEWSTARPGRTLPPGKIR